jgi:hypothetical protein
MNEQTINQGGEKVNNKSYISYQVGGSEYYKSEVKFENSDDYNLAGEYAYFTISNALGKPFIGNLEVVAIQVHFATSEKPEQGFLLGRRSWHKVYGLQDSTAEF